MLLQQESASDRVPDVPPRTIPEYTEAVGAEDIIDSLTTEGDGLLKENQTSVLKVREHF